MHLPAPWSGGHPAALRSPWLREALAAERASPAPPFRGRSRCDVCIVGGGFTGLWTAILLRERESDADVVLLEADTCGGGASGANAGYLMNLWPKYASLRAIVGHDEAHRIAAASSRAIDEIEQFCAQNAIDAQIRADAWVWTASNPAQVGAWDETIAALEDVPSHPLRVIDADEVSAMTGSVVDLAGVVDATCRTLQPAMLARGLRRVAIERGVRVHEQSPVRAVEPGIKVHTEDGVLAAARVGLAINAWATSVRPLMRTMVLVASDTVLTMPIPDLLRRAGWNGGCAISDSRRRLNYFRDTPDGRFVFGKGGVGVGYGGRAASRGWGVSPRVAELQEQLSRAYPDLTDAPIDAAWTAPVEYSATSLPFCAPLDPPGVWCVAGYSGDGVGPSRVLARMLGAVLIDGDDEWATTGLHGIPSARMPPEPFRFLGGRLVGGALARREAKEDRGVAVGAVIDRVSSLDPTRFAG